MASDRASVHAVLGLLDLHSFKTLEHAVEQFKAHKQRFNESLSELKSLKPSAGIPSVAFSQPSCQGMQERCTPRITATGADSLSVSTQMRCTPLKPPLSSMIVQEGIENHGYSLRPRASRKLSSSGAPQRITRSRAKQPATSTAGACNNSRKSEFIVLEDDFVEITRSHSKQPATITAAACNNSRKPEFIVLEDDFVELEAKVSRKPGQHQQASFQHECPIEAAVSLSPQLVKQMLLSNKGYSVTPCQNPVNCNRKHLHMHHEEGACDGSFSRGHSIDTDACALSSGDPVLVLTGTQQLHHLSPHLVQQIPSLHKGPSGTPCQNISNCSREHLSAHHAEGANIGSFSRNQSIGTHAIVSEKSSPARVHLPTPVEQPSKQIIDVVHCEVNQEKRLPSDAEDGAYITCPEKDNALALQPSSMSLRHSLPSTCQEFDGTDTMQSNSHKRKVSVFEGSGSGIVPNDDVKRRKRYSSSINTIEIEAFKFDLDDAYFDKEGSKHFTFTASFCKVNRRSLCVQGDHDQARPSASKGLSTPGTNDSAKVHKLNIETAETGIDWHANSVALEKPCGILSEAQYEPAGSGAHAWDNTLPRDIQERKSALPDSFQVVTQNLHQAHEVIEPPPESLRDTYVEECNKESQTEASEKQDGLGLECACADQLLLSNWNSSTWHTGLQGVLKDVQGGKLTSPDSLQATTQKLSKALEMTESSFDNPKDTCVEEFNNEFQHEASEKQDNLMLECACADQLLSSDLNSPTCRDNSLQGVFKDIQEEKPATPDAFRVTAQELYQAQEMIEPSFDNLKDMHTEECNIEFQSEASEKQDDLVLECTQADQLLPSNLNSPAVCFSAKVQPEEEKMCSLSSKSRLRLTTSAEVQPCGHELAEGPSTRGIDDSAKVKGFSIGRVEIGLDWHANCVASEKPCGILSQAHYEAAGSGPHAWDSSLQGVLKNIQAGKPALPESFQVTTQKLDQVHVAMESPLDNSSDTSMEECNNDSQSEASEKQDGLVLECAHADQPLLSNSGSPAVCFSLKVQPGQKALSSRGNAIVNDYLPSRTGFNSLQMQVKSSNKLCKSYSRLSGLRRECIDTPHMNSARADFADRTSTKFRSFECRLDTYLEDGKENQTPEPWSKDKVYSGTGLPSEKQATAGTRKVLGCSNQSLGGLVESAHKRYNLAVETRSFLDFVQQKQLPLHYPNGKRDVRVKALEAAELARREEERRENERKMRRLECNEAKGAELARREEERCENERKMRRLECNEAKGAELESCKDKMIPSCASTITAKGVTEKVKRVAELKMKMDQEKAKKQEVEQKKKEEERKKKEAEIADKKRKREDADRKDREEKRKRVEEVQKLKKEQEERQRLELEEKEHKRKVLEERERERKAQGEEAKKLRRLQKEREAERRRKQEQHLKASRLAEKQAERKRKEAMLKARGYEDDSAAQLALGNKLSILSTESFAISTSTDWEAQSKSTMRTRSQTSEDRWGFRVPSLGASVYGQTNNGKLSTSACFVGNGTPFPMNTVKNEAGFKFEASKSLKSQYSTPFSLKLGAYAPAQQAHLESNIQSYEISPYKSSSSDDEDEDDRPKKTYSSLGKEREPATTDIVAAMYGPR